jgi:hypothetical protein
MSLIFFEKIIIKFLFKSSKFEISSSSTTNNNNHFTFFPILPSVETLPSQIFFKLNLLFASLVFRYHYF